MNIEEEDQAPAWLRQLRVTKVALVDRGANQHANITIYKRKETHITSIASQSVIFQNIRKRAVREFPELPEPQAIDR